MASISLSRRIDAPSGRVRDAIADVEPFMRAAGFDEVERDGDALRIARVLGLARIELRLRLLDDPDAALAYEQVDGIFEAMAARYVVDDADGGTTVTATTDFTLGGVAGTVLDASLVKRQRAREIEAQFDYLETLAGE